MQIHQRGNRMLIYGFPETKTKEEGGERPRAVNREDRKLSYTIFGLRTRKNHFLMKIIKSKKSQSHVHNPRKQEQTSE